MRRHSRPLAGISLLLVVFGLALGCRQEIEPLFRRNQQPETTVTVIPEDSAQGFYRYHVYWRGEDVDGRVIRYIFAITDTLSRDEEQNWNPQIAEDRDRGVYTTKTDSIFVFDSQRGRQAFNIVAIDDFGDRDRSPARAFFRIVDNGLPRVQFLGVQGFRDPNILLPPCNAADPCTIPTFTNFKVSFTGTTANNSITGFQWQGIEPGQVDPEPFQPFGADSLFLPAGRDTTGFVPGTPDTSWTLRGSVVTVYYRNVRQSPGDSIPSITPGNFLFRARVRDQARLVSLLSSGTRRVTVNYDPQTRLYRIPACDCPHPPPNCSSRDSVVAGYIVGVEDSAFTDDSQWIRFCAGDTLPQLAWVRFFSRGSDDGRDLPRRPPALREVGYSARFSWKAGTPPNEIANSNMPFSSEYQAADYVLPPPDSRSWRGFFNGWGDARFQGLCPFDFRYYVSAVDENGKRDGTPDSLYFFVSGTPSIDSIKAPLVVVLTPKCPPGFNSFCPDTTNIRFGADTVMVVGQYVDVQRPPGCNFPTGCTGTPSPCGCNAGLNLFRLPFAIYGHDHPRDRDNPPRYVYTSATVGRIRSWKFGFQCSGVGCEDLNLPGESQWRNDTQRSSDPLGQEIFDDSLQLTAELDTFLISGPLPVKLGLTTTSLGSHLFTVQGRDTDAGGQKCIEPSDLGPRPASFERSVSEQGRTTAFIERPVVLRQLQDVRPYVPPRAAAANTRNSRKGWWRR